MGNASWGKAAANRSELPWQMSDIPFLGVQRDRVRNDEALFFVLASSSLVESGTQVYTRILAERFSANSELMTWLERNWRQEELQHGEALRTYVETVWPEFDWQAAFTAFDAEYSTYCSVEQLEPTPALELVARCMIETGTASLYKAIHDYTDEPVLKKLAGLIRSDEARHYQHFFDHYQGYRRRESVGRWGVLRALARRLAEIDDEDADCALRHVFAVRYPNCSLDSTAFRELSRAARSLVATRLPRRMVVKMAIKPLDLPDTLQNYLVPPVSKAIELFFRGA